MQKMTLILGLVLMVTLAGCAAASKFAPSQLDANGQPIAGTHQLTPLAKDVTDAIPYGGVGASMLLLVWNFVERARSNRTTVGLKATIKAIEVAAKDPETKDAIAKLKLQLSEAHQSANVQPLINRLLAQVKFRI